MTPLGVIALVNWLLFLWTVTAFWDETKDAPVIAHNPVGAFGAICAWFVSNAAITIAATTGAR